MRHRQVTLIPDMVFPLCGQEVFYSHPVRNDRHSGLRIYCWCIGTHMQARWDVEELLTEHLPVSIASGHLDGCPGGIALFPAPRLFRLKLEVRGTGPSETHLGAIARLVP